MRRGLITALVWAGLGFPAMALAPVGTIPAYPGATRPLPHWETPSRAIALTRDKPGAVVAYYLASLPRAGWRTPEDEAAVALAAASASEPAWLTFSRPGHGRLDLQVTAGKHPSTGEAVTLIFTRSDFKP